MVTIVYGGQSIDVDDCEDATLEQAKSMLEARYEIDIDQDVRVLVDDVPASLTDTIGEADEIRFTTAAGKKA